MAWSWDTHELAWATGFFDGEGSTYLDPRPRMQVVQNDPYVLNRFAAAVGDLGKLGGGKKIYGRAKQPMWSYRVTGWRNVQAVVCMLWPWLSPQKQEQALVALRINLHKMQDDPRFGGKRRYPVACGDISADHRVAACRACRASAQRRYTARKRTAKAGQ